MARTKAVVRAIAEVRPAFISVTYGAAGGTTGANTCALARFVQADCGVPALAHMTCVAADRAKVADEIRGFRAAGIENTVSAGEIGALLEGLYAGALVSPQASAQMLEILRNQKLNGKMPFYLKPRGIACAHKTGEDDGITHDVGIVYARKPFVLCMLSEETEVPAFERLIQEIARELADTNS